MKLKITSIKGAEHVDCSLSDCMPDGFWRPGKVTLRTVDEFPVSELPEAEFEQFGHTVAYGTMSMSLRRAKRMFGVVRKGDVVEIKNFKFRRNRAMRKAGTFQVYAWEGGER